VILHSVALNNLLLQAVIKLKFTDVTFAFIRYLNCSNCVSFTLTRSLGRQKAFMYCVIHTTKWSFCKAFLLLKRRVASEFAPLCMALTDNTNRLNNWMRIQVLLGALAKLRKEGNYLRHVCPSSCPFLRPHGTNRPPLNGFSWNSVFEYFSKICPENSNFIKIWQE
jgi:hypothetical protein